MCHRRRPRLLTVDECERDNFSERLVERILRQSGVSCVGKCASWIPAKTWRNPGLRPRGSISLIEGFHHGEDIKIIAT